MVTEVNFLALKHRVRDILATDDSIYYEPKGTEETNATQGKVTINVVEEPGTKDVYYQKLRSIEVGEPEDYFSVPTPYCFITDGKPKEPVDKPAGQIVAGRVQSSLHTIRLIVVIMAQEKDARTTESTLDILYQKVKERLKAFPYLTHPVSGTNDYNVKFAHPIFGDNFLVASVDKTLAGEMIVLEAQLFTSGA